MQKLFNSFTKQATLTRKSTILSLPLQLLFTDMTNNNNIMGSLFN